MIVLRTIVVQASILKFQSPICAPGQPLVGFSPAIDRSLLSRLSVPICSVRLRDLSLYLRRGQETDLLALRAGLSANLAGCASVNELPRLLAVPKDST